jgi:hypothetical protein
MSLCLASGGEVGQSSVPELRNRAGGQCFDRVLGTSEDLGDGPNRKVAVVAQHQGCALAVWKACDLSAYRKRSREIDPVGRGRDTRRAAFEGATALRASEV